MNFTTIESLNPVVCAVNASGNIINQILQDKGEKPFYKDWLFWLLPTPYLIYKYFSRASELRQKKEALYKETIERQNKIIRILQEKHKLNEEQIRKLERINDELLAYIRQLKQDLEAA